MTAHSKCRKDVSGSHRAPLTPHIEREGHNENTNSSIEIVSASCLSGAGLLAGWSTSASATQLDQR